MKAKTAVIFKIKRTPPSLNTMLRTHYRQRLREQDSWDLQVYAHWMAHKKMVFLVPVEITYTLSFSTKRYRDLDNYIGGTKYITDALTRSFIKRDDAGRLKRIEVKFLSGPNETEITIEEA